MKKKIMAIGLTVAVLAIAIVGMTLAYFTDEEPATNTFTIGNVEIGLNEQQRNDDGTALVDFEQNKPLIPIVGSAQGDKDDFGLPTAANYVDKVVTIENTGDNAAYIRAYFAIPSVLDDGADDFNAGHNILHFNFGNKVTEDGQVVTTYQNEWKWKNTDGSWKYFETTIGEISYNVYYADYYEAVPSGVTTERFIDGVYLDSTVDVDYDAQGNISALWHQGEIVDIGNLRLNNIQCPVFAIACQAAGFESAEAAFNAAFESAEAPFNSAFPIPTPTPAPTDEPVE